mmetsp:Transcript_29337/g.73660  ORF Transcript_29337/g.73660 Transcript_29337/m.73660 type:complete len:233 (+) Transcript_29337:1035-1733(+)
MPPLPEYISSSEQPSGARYQSLGLPSQAKHHSSTTSPAPASGVGGVGGRPSAAKMGGNKISTFSVLGTWTTASKRRPWLGEKTLMNTRTVELTPIYARGVMASRPAPSARSRKKFCRAPPEDSPSVHFVSNAYTPDGPSSSAPTGALLLSISKCLGASGKLHASRPCASKLRENRQRRSTGAPNARVTTASNSAFVAEAGKQMRKGHTKPHPRATRGNGSKVWKTLKPKSST